MEMRIVVPTAASTRALAERLSAAFGAERISLLGDRQEVDVRVDSESDNAVVHVLETVERWLDRANVRSAEMWLGKNSYRIAPWVPVNKLPGDSRLPMGRNGRS
jgi:hypothetical protein